MYAGFTLGCRAFAGVLIILPTYLFHSLKGFAVYIPVVCIAVGIVIKFRSLQSTSHKDAPGLEQVHSSTHAAAMGSSYVQQPANSQRRMVVVARAPLGEIQCVCGKGGKGGVPDRAKGTENTSTAATTRPPMIHEQ